MMRSDEKSMSDEGRDIYYFISLYVAINIVVSAAAMLFCVSVCDHLGVMLGALKMRE